MSARKETIGIVGLGYVGLPLAVVFSRRFDVVGYDVSSERIRELESGHDHTGEVECSALRSARLSFTAEAAKVIENVQRDLNIALMNELSKIFARIGLAALRKKMRTPVLVDVKNLFSRYEARRLGFRYASLLNNQAELRKAT